MKDTLVLCGFAEQSLVDGEGIRFVIFTAGCNHACEGCGSKHTWNISNGYYFPFETIFEKIKENLELIDGITLSGGDPLYQEEATVDFLTAFRNINEFKHLNVWLYTGREFRNVPASVRHLVDVIVDGKYNKDLPPAKFRGSCNQLVLKKNKDGFYRNYKYEGDPDENSCTRALFNNTGEYSPEVFEP